MIVIKYGGNAMTNQALRQAVAKEIQALANEGLHPIVVHGGGPFIKAALDDAGINHEFIQGLRVTSKESLSVIEPVLTMLNKQLAQDITRAIGLTGRDAHILQAKRFDESLGYVGRMTQVNSTLLTALLKVPLTPVLACLAENETGEGMLNVNADEVAGAVAGALSAPVIFLSNVIGVLDDPKDEKSLQTELSRQDIHERIQDGRISGGMIPKVNAALYALEKGASYSVIADGRKPNNLKKALDKQTGTRIYL